MKRRNFITLSAGLLAAPISMTRRIPEPELFYFADDGAMPNSRYPLLLYRNAFAARDEQGAVWLEQHFLDNNWSNSWRNGIFSFHHYHSITHEVLGLYSGSALVHLGGESGRKLTISAGDVVVIPAGVGHKNLGSEALGVVGAYPNGMPVDIRRGQAGERPRTDQNIANVPLPAEDPLLGRRSGLLDIWGKIG